MLLPLRLAMAMEKIEVEGRLKGREESREVTVINFCLVGTRKA
jgi:hypothetical protein